MSAEPLPLESAPRVDRGVRYGLWPEGEDRFMDVLDEWTPTSPIHKVAAQRCECQ